MKFGIEFETIEELFENERFKKVCENTYKTGAVVGAGIVYVEDTYSSSLVEETIKKFVISGKEYLDSLEQPKEEFESIKTSFGTMFIHVIIWKELRKHNEIKYFEYSVSVLTKNDYDV